MNTRAVFSDIHRNALKIREDKDGQSRAVSIARTLPVTK